MKKELNLVEILKDCLVGTKLYSLVYGEEKLESVVPGSLYPIKTFKHSYTLDGKLFYNDGDCVLFPSENQRDWGNFVPPIKKWSPTELQPFDKILVRDYDSSHWHIDLFGFMDRKSVAGCSGTYWSTVIPYNDETENFIGTKHDAPEKYRWWEE